MGLRYPRMHIPQSVFMHVTNSPSSCTLPYRLLHHHPLPILASICIFIPTNGISHTSAVQWAGDSGGKLLLSEWGGKEWFEAPRGDLVLGSDRV